MPITLYFEHGRVVELFPEPNQSYYDVRDKINAATDIVSDGIKYDLTDKQSIYSIAIPDYTKFRDVPRFKELGPTGYLEYVLRMHAGLFCSQREAVAAACLHRTSPSTALSRLRFDPLTTSDKFHCYKKVQHLHRKDMMLSEHSETMSGAKRLVKTNASRYCRQSRLTVANSKKFFLPRI